MAKSEKPKTEQQESKPPKQPKQPKPPRPPKTVKPKKESGQKRWRRTGQEGEQQKPFNPMELLPQYTRAAWNRLEQIPNQKGLRRRWLLNSVGVMTLVAVLVVLLSSFAISNYYYSNMRTGLESMAESATSFISSYSTNQKTYLNVAGIYISEFKMSSVLNLQLIDTNGKVVRTTYEISGSRPGTSDITNAIANGDTSTFTGRDPSTGERIMAVSSPVVVNGEVKGVIRLVTSCTAVDRQILLLTCAIVLVAIFIVLLMYFMSLYFIQSIIVPVNDITQFAKNIAAGTYGIQMKQQQYEDEIGDLVTAINDMSTKISESERMRNEFISSVSHELRTPLTAINGWSQTLLSGGLDAENQKMGLRIIANESQRLAKMVEDLLDFSRIENGRFAVNIEEIDIQAEFEDALFIYQQYFQERNLRLVQHDCDEEFPPIPGDPARLRQVFTNLLDNAIKYAADGGEVDTYIDRDDGMVRIRIRDHGPGIPEAALPHVKEKFFRANSTTSIRGNGIGLSVCDEIINRHGGRLDITNAEGGGCLATIHLPMTAPTVKAATLRETFQGTARDALQGVVNPEGKE